MASSTTHGLLLCLLLFGSAFVAANHKKDDDLLDKPVLKFIPANAIINDHITTAPPGNPKADPDKTPAVLPPPPPNVVPVFHPPTPVARVVPAPAPVKPEPKQIKPVEEDKDELIDPKGLEPVVPKNRVRVNKEFTKRTNDEKAKQHKLEQEAAEREEREEREAQAKYERQVQAYNTSRQAIASKIHSTVSGINSEKGSPTTVEVYGAGGQAYVTYGDFVKTVYQAAWERLSPEEANDESNLVKVRVTVARDGAVLSSQIVTPSNNPLVDRAVQRTLSTVRDIGQPFPPGAKDAKRTFIFRFDLKAKKGLG